VMTVASFHGNNRGFILTLSVHSNSNEPSSLSKHSVKPEGNRQAVFFERIR
jgi:hypothetical protein